MAPPRMSGPPDTTGRNGPPDATPERPFPGGRPVRIGVLLSGKGRGTNLQAILDSCDAGRIDGTVEVVASTTPGAPALDRARAKSIPAVTLSRQEFPGDEALDAALVECFQAHRVDLICLSGFMRKAGPRLCHAYRWRILNIHPGLIPAFCGRGLYGGRVHEAVIAYGAKVSGATVHFANEEYDAGPIVLQRCVPVEEDDTAETLAARILPVEHQVYSEAIQLFAEGRLEVIAGRRVRIRERNTG